MTDQTQNPALRSVAIVGMSGRFPGASSTEQFWQNLRDGVESIVALSDEDLDAAGVDPSLRQSPNYVRAAAVLSDIDRFDARFFGYSPREADLLDPQQRLFLECAWEAIEQAGYDPPTCPGAVGVFAGMSTSAYLDVLRAARPEGAPASAFELAISTDKDYLATRVAYKLNLRGPCLTVQTACSTSLVAVVLACQSLLDYQCDMALAGGATVQVPPKAGYVYEEEGILSPDGHCRPFDAAARGTVFGSGVGAVLLKRTEDAIAAGDPVLALIRGWAVNNDGAGKVGYTAPSVDGQAEVIAMAQAVAGVEAESISYVEAHGTATALGDPIELAALSQVFGVSTSRTKFCALGSVKSNIGHLDAAAGIAGLIKTVLALQHRQIPPSLNFREPNPRFDMERSPFFLNAQLADWPAGETPRRAAVSSFGIGGTNAHVVLEEAPPTPSAADAKQSHLLVLSAKSATALERATANLLNYLKQHPDLPIADVVYTLQVGRGRFAHRRMVVCDDVAEAIAALETPGSADTATNVVDTASRPVAFLFPGQGAQYVGMGRGLYASEPVFRRHVDRCAELLMPHLGLDLREVLYPSGDGAGTTAHDLDQTALSQPALFVVEYALAQLWISCGVRPDVMIGHSIGEYVAACLAGVLVLEDALALVAARGHLMQQVPAGAMLAVPLPEQKVLSLLGADLSLAALNSPSMCVVAGPPEAVDRLQRQLAEKGIDSTRLRTSRAFHSSAMEPVLGPFTKLVSSVALHPPQLPYLSNVTGTWATEAVADPAYWAAHIRQTVRFSDGLAELLQDQHRLVLEVGPGQTLSRFARQHAAYRDRQNAVGSLRHLRDRQADRDFFLASVGRLWLSGVPVDWAGLHTQEQRRRLPLPAYPFERDRHWIEGAKPTGGDRVAGSMPHKLPDIADWFSVPSWRRMPAAADDPRGRGGDERAPWLVLSDAHGLGSQVVDRLAGGGDRVVTVVSGDAFGRQGETRYAINPRRPEDYRSLLGELEARQLFPRTIVHLWGAGPEARDNAQAWADDLFWSLMFLAQALGDQTLEAPVHIEVITSSLHAVTGDDVPVPLKAVALGPIKVIPQEYPAIRCRNIDVAFPVSGSHAQAKLLAAVVAEFRLPPSDAVVAYRGGYRWLQTFEPVRLDGAATGRTRLRMGGVYLITGGLGGIGLTLAEHLAQSLRPKLVLIGRTGLPERAAWRDWVEGHTDQDEVSRKIRKVLALEEQGAEVIVRRADVTDPSAMADVVRETLERFGALHGVIHAAGSAGGGVIQLKTPEAAAGVLAPKVQGTLALVDALKGMQLDFLALCSSVDAIMGGAGRSDYCGANAFLDAYAQRAAAEDGRFVVAINWDTWQEVGMAADAVVPSGLEHQKAESLREGILSREGVEVFRRILAASLPQVVVSTRELQGRMQRERSQRAESPTIEPTRATPAQRKHARPALGTGYSAPRTEMERTMAELWQDLLGIERVGIGDDFFELGGHSLLAVQFISRMRSARQIKLSLQTLFESPTIAELASRLAPTDLPQGEEGDEVVRLLGLVEQLSDDAVRALLSKTAANE